LSLFLAASEVQEELALKQIFLVNQELRKKGVSCHILAGADSKLFAYGKKNGLQVLSFNFKPSFLTTWKLSRLLKKHQARLIHFLDEASFQAGMKAVSKAGVPVCLATFQPDWLKKNYQANLKHLDAIICPNEETKKKLLKAEVPVNSLEVIPPGLDFARYQSEKKSDFLRAELGLSREDTLVGWVTPLEDLKNFKAQLEALKILDQQAPKLKIIIFGLGPLHLEQLRHELPLELKNLYFYLGFEDKRAEVFSSLDMFVFGDFSLPEELLLEAMVRKVPVVGVMASGRSEILLHRETGYLVPPNDPQALAQVVLKIYLDRSLAQNLGKQAYELVYNKHSGEAMAQKLVNFYELMALQKGVKLGG